METKRFFSATVSVASMSMLLMGFACSNNPPKPTATTTGTATASGNPLGGPGGPGGGAGHSPDPATLDFCTRQGWTQICTVPEYTDDQMLNTGSDSLGPLAKVIPADGLAMRSQASFAMVGAAVGGILIRAPLNSGLPPSYNALNLHAGNNCIYLQSTGDGYKAFIIKEVSSTSIPCPPRTPAQLAIEPALPVDARAFPRWPASSDIPPVARFHESKHVGGRQPLVGVKCDNRWCVIGPANPPLMAPPQYGVNADQRDWVVRGWSDAQRLSVKVGSTLKYGDFEAAVIPGPAASFTSETQFESTAAVAATIYVVGMMNPLQNPYHETWGLSNGKNELYIMKVNGQWTGKIVSHGMGCGAAGCPTTVNVQRTDHQNVYPPATARFMWDPNDEGLWVRCDDGCCKVSGTGGGT